MAEFDRMMQENERTLAETNRMVEENQVRREEERGGERRGEE